MGAVLAALLFALVVPVLLTTDGSRAEPVAQADTTAQSERDPAAIGPARFPHDEHAEDLEIECKECHHETDAAPLTFPHQDYFDDFWIDCRICHHDTRPVSTEPRPCSACHHSPNGNIADETLSAKVVIHKKCWECHDTGTGAEASATCTDCHEE